MNKRGTKSGKSRPTRQNIMKKKNNTSIIPVSLLLEAIVFNLKKKKKNKVEIDNAKSVNAIGSILRGKKKKKKKKKL